MSIDSQHFRDALANLASGVSVITTQHDGQPIGITVSSFTSLSLHPPLILFCLNLTSKSKPAFAVRRPFAVNILSEDQQHIARHFASPGKKSWDTIAYDETSSGVRTLRNSLVALGCTVAKQHKSGDHVIIIGKVNAVSAVQKTAKPLLHFRRHYYDIGKVMD